MATIVNNPGTTTDSSNSTGLIVAAILLIAAVFFFLYLGRPLLNNASFGSGGGSAPTIQVPDKVDVNVNPGTGQ